MTVERMAAGFQLDPAKEGKKGPTKPWSRSSASPPPTTPRPPPPQVLRHESFWAESIVANARLDVWFFCFKTLYNVLQKPGKVPPNHPPLVKLQQLLQQWKDGQRRAGGLGSGLVAFGRPPFSLPVDTPN